MAQVGDGKVKKCRTVKGSGKPPKASRSKGKVSKQKRMGGQQEAGGKGIGGATGWAKPKKAKKITNPSMLPGRSTGVRSQARGCG